ncbi:hypothetical protein [Thermoplasma sp.]|uniref:hypothetical protein n=1 Tax=Thermoplasma sp. TaxID=1973142 RepID=UPI001281B257|nr:hypothetical protein [Thermoplasma sp.]KAA8923121.1 MAG: hypothetical protein F6Q11_01115 [Thermoplasma sp.]
MKREDNAVAEIIGTVLIFVIVVTLLTAYASWYVPLQEQRSQQAFYQNAISAENELSAKAIQGYSFVQSFPAGISGGFGNTFDTYLSFLNLSYGNFNAKLSVVLAAGGKTVYDNYTLNFTQSGIISAYPSSNFLMQMSVNDYGSFVTDGSVFYGPLFIRTSNSSFSLSLVRMSGENFSESSSSSMYVSGTAMYHDFIYFNVNGSVPYNGTEATVRSIEMDGMNYTITGPFTKSLEKYIMVNSGMAPASGNATVGSYRIILSSDTLMMSLQNPIQLESIGISYVLCYVSL